MRILLKAIGYLLLVLVSSFAVVDLTRLIATGGMDSLAALGRLYGLALTAAAGLLVWRAAERHPSPPVRNPAWHLAALLSGMLLALLAAGLFALALTSVLTNTGLPEADPSLWGLLCFFGGVAVGGSLFALGEYRRLCQAKAQVHSTPALQEAEARPRSSRWPRRWGWLRVAASLVLGLGLLVQGIALVQRAQTTNGMDVGANAAGMLAGIILPLSAAVLIAATITTIALLRPDAVPCELAGGVGFVTGIAGILMALLASASIGAGTILLLPAIVLFFTANLASLFAYAREYSPRLSPPAIPTR